MSAQLQTPTDEYACNHGFKQMSVQSVHRGKMCSASKLQHTTCRTHALHPQSVCSPSFRSWALQCAHSLQPVVCCRETQTCSWSLCLLCITQGRTALDLLSEELKGFMEHEQAGLVYSWGNGANYQLGTGATGLQAGAVRLDALRKELVVHIAAAKYHSAAVTKDGQLFTWGFGRGGRLGAFPLSAHLDCLWLFVDCTSKSCRVYSRSLPIAMVKCHQCCTC